MITPIRPGHGDGANGYHVEVPLKDLQPANAADTEAGLTERKRRGRPFQDGNRAAEGRKPMLALLGIAADEVPEPARKDLKRAERYRQRRVREVGCAHGGFCDSGTGAVLGSAALVLASQRQVAAMAFKTGDPALHKLATDLAEKHSQLEIKASFMAKDSAASRPKQTTGLDRLRASLAGKGGAP
ncbi:MAG TPA: hypothetical protein VFK05_19170 [Polyangiaceae bacterium]|nr:hypothetical protein [Polyangiaceae bacterium]